MFLLEISNYKGCKAIISPVYFIIEFQHPEYVWGVCANVMTLVIQMVDSTQTCDYSNLKVHKERPSSMFERGFPIRYA